MLLLTAVSQFGISPKMATLRAQFGDIDTVPATDPGRVQFDALHLWSVRWKSRFLRWGSLRCSVRLVISPDRRASVP